jgi:hypothetical protein
VESFFRGIAEHFAARANEHYYKKKGRFALFITDPQRGTAR